MLLSGLRLDHRGRPASAKRRAARPAPRRVHRLPARRLSAAGHDVRGDARAGTTEIAECRSPTAKRVRAAADPAGRTAASKCAAAATPRGRSSTSCRRRLRPTACSSARCSRRRATGRAIRRTSTTGTQPPVEADLEETYYYRFSGHDGYGIQRLYTRDGPHRADDAGHATATW